MTEPNKTTEAGDASKVGAAQPAPDLQSWVGRTRTIEDVADARSATRLAMLLSDQSTETPGLLFPLGHWLYFNEGVPLSECGTDGHPRLGGFMPPVPLPRRMWAGSRLEFHAPISVGASLERTTRIESVTEKTGSTGPLCFVVLRHEVRANGVHALTDRHTIVYRQAEPTGVDGANSNAREPRQDSEVPGGWEWSESVRPTEVMLFRYSALTFNSHRIHYDHPYVTEVEGYPGLVTHGPLTATLLLNAFINAQPGATVTGYDFTAKSPLFANEQIHLVGRCTDPGVHELQAIAPDGKTAIAATVRATESNVSTNDTTASARERQS